MRYALAYIAAAAAVHVLIVLIASYAALEWQNPLDWTGEERLAALIASLWLGILGLPLGFMRR